MFSVPPVKRGKISTFTLNLIAIRSIVVSWLPTVTGAIVSLRRSISLECLYYTTEYVQYQRFKVYDTKLSVAKTVNITTYMNFMFVLEYMHAYHL